MRRAAAIVTMLLILAVLSWSLGCAKPAPSPTAAPSPPPAPSVKPSPTAAPTAPASQQPAWPTKLILSTVPPAMAVSVYGVGVAAIIEKHLKIPTTPENSSGNVEATMILLQGKSQLGTTSAVNGNSILKNEKPWPANSSKVMRGITFGGYKGVAHWVVLAKSNINTFADLKGKKVMAVREGEPSYEDMWRAAITAYGMTEKDIVAVPELGLANQTIALKEGRTDAFMVMTGVPTAALMELANTNPIRLLSHTEAGAKAAIGKLPWMARPDTIPAGTYKGQDKDVIALMVNLGISARAELPESLVYAIAKALDENIGELKAVHQSFAKWTMKDLANSPYLPYHAGALKYYMEKGLLTPESIEKHKSLLAMTGEKS